MGPPDVILYLLLLTASTAVELDIHIPLSSSETLSSSLSSLSSISPRLSAPRLSSPSKPASLASLSSGCAENEALQANLLLRQYSTPFSSLNGLPPSPLEQIDFFQLHTPHITLFLTDFDLEADYDAQYDQYDQYGQSIQSSEAPGDNRSEEVGSRGDQDKRLQSLPLNQTKVNFFLDALSSLNFTNITQGRACSLSFASSLSSSLGSSHTRSSSMYSIQGSYTLLHIQTLPCLQELSNAVVQTMQPFVKRPASVPDWVYQMKEPERSQAIERCHVYGSPTVLEGFMPHVTVGFYDPSQREGGGEHTDTTTAAKSQSNNHDHIDSVVVISKHWREEAMEEWAETFYSNKPSPSSNSNAHDNCRDIARGVAVGHVGDFGGTVLQNGRLGYWKLASEGLGMEDESTNRQET